MNFNRLFERIKNEPEWVVLIVLVLLIAVGGGVFYYYQYRQEARDARQSFRRSLALFNRADRTGNYQRALTVLRRYINNHPDANNTDKVHFFLAKSYYETGQYVSAIRQFRRLRNDYPDSLFAESALLYVGYANVQRNRYTQARRSFRKLADEATEHPLWPEAQWQTALLEYQLGNTDRAKKALETLLQSDRELEAFWKNWAQRLKNRLTARS